MTAGGKTSSYLYDADGNLLLQKDPGTTTLYLDGGAEQLQLSGTTVTGQRYYTSPDGTVITRSSSGAITYQTASQQHTALESVSASTLSITRRYYDPYGKPAAALPSWPDNHGFVNKPADTATGLDLLGARQYDPVTGAFLSPDPVFESGDPLQMGGYAYAGDNPATSADPTGLCMRLTATDSCNYDPTTGKPTGTGTPDKRPVQQAPTPCYSSWQGCNGYEAPPFSLPKRPKTKVQPYNAQSCAHLGGECGGTPVEYNNDSNDTGLFLDWILGYHQHEDFNQWDPLTQYLMRDSNQSKALALIRYALTHGGLSCRSCRLC